MLNRKMLNVKKHKEEVKVFDEYEYLIINLLEKQEHEPTIEPSDLINFLSYYVTNIGTDSETFSKILCYMEKTVEEYKVLLKEKESNDHDTHTQ